MLFLVESLNIVIAVAGNALLLKKLHDGLARRAKESMDPARTVQVRRELAARNRALRNWLNRG